MFPRISHHTIELITTGWKVSRKRFLLNEFHRLTRKINATPYLENVPRNEIMIN